MKATLPPSNLPRILIVGGGFGGLKLARALRKAPFQLVLVDRHNYHTFQPLLYQVATGGLEPDSIAFPLRKALEKQSNLIFRIAEVQHIHAEEKVAETSIGDIPYDYLVLATGSTTNFFGMQQIESLAVGMKSIPEALDLRSLILQNFEAALQETHYEQRSRLMKFVVVGGGPTGVETAGALAELKRHVLPNDYTELDFNQMEIHLLEAGPSLLAGMSEKASTTAKRSLEKLGVHVWLNTMVTGYDGFRVETKGDRNFETGALIWAAGIKGNVPDGIDPGVIVRGNRLVVDAYNRVEGWENIFAIGDIAFMKTGKYPQGHPQVAPVAIQQAENLALNLLYPLKGGKFREFSYFDKGSMATVGRNKAVVDIGKLHLRGLPAWVTWMFVHLLSLIGFRNKLVVFINWVWSYITYDKGTRLIIRPFKKKPLEKVI